MGLIVSCRNLPRLVHNNVPVRNIIVNVDTFGVVGKAKSVSDSVASLDLIFSEHMAVQI